MVRGGEEKLLIRIVNQGAVVNVDSIRMTVFRIARFHTFLSLRWVKTTPQKRLGKTNQQKKITHRKKSNYIVKSEPFVRIIKYYS